MQNMNKKNHQQALPLTISTSIDEAPLLRHLVEKLAHRRIDPGYGGLAVPEGSRVIETSSLEAYVSGSTYMNDTVEEVLMPYATGFFFTCIKLGKEYSLSWACSLS